MHVNQRPRFSAPAWHSTWGQKVHNSAKLLVQTPALWRRWNILPPEYRKPLRVVGRDLLCLIWRYDFKTKWVMDYFGDATWRRDCPVEHYVLWNEWERLKIWVDRGKMARMLNRKEGAWRYLKEAGYPVPRRLGILKLAEGVPVCQLYGGEILPLDALLARIGGIFVKPDAGMQGWGCALIQPGGGRGEYLVNGQLQNQEAVSALLEWPLHVEAVIHSHPRLAAFHPESVNTLRLITIMGKNGTVGLKASVLRMGTGKSCLDNWSAGGLAVRIEADGRLAREAWYRGGMRPPCTEHPDTRVVFEGYEIPFYQEAVKLVLHIHRECPEIFGIGWDVAITSEGPLIIESNVSFGIGLIQYLYGGLRELMNQSLRPLAESARKKALDE